MCNSLKKFLENVSNGLIEPFKDETPVIKLESNRVEEDVKMGGNLIDIMADRLKEQFPSLSMDEGRVIAHTYMIRDCKSIAMTGNPHTPPDWYIDSSVGLGFLDSPGTMARYCQSLVAGDYLCEHSTEAGMVRISDRMIPVCEKIINNL